MSDQYRQCVRGGRMRLVRTTSILFALLVCLLLVQAATASADVMQKHRAAYKSKLTYYRNKMDAENTFYLASRLATEATSGDIASAVANTEHPENVKIVEQLALDQRSLLQDATAKSRDKIYANIAAFKAKALDWFKSKSDKKRFKASVAIMRGGFVQIFSADEDLMEALYLLGTNADTGGANNEIMSAGMTATTADDLFDRGLKQLRDLQ
jgi:hypothetical protein